MKESFDLAVIGGGINGVGIAADAAGRGLNVLLLEAGDLACATSSASSKLIHGGLRYLEHFEFRLVREALQERETILHIAPHIAWPLRFRLPHRPHLRPAWMVRAGLFLYDHLSTRNHLPGCRWIHFHTQDGLKKEIRSGFEYSDVWVDDARLVILNALLAQEKGAQICTQTPCTEVRTENNLWQIKATDKLTGTEKSFQAKGLVNACGPWAELFFKEQLQQQSPRTIRHIKGSHIVVPPLYQGDHAYILQNSDGRIVFVLPYENNYSLIGTTDVNYQGDLHKVEISPEEVNYLCEIINAHFESGIKPQDVVWSYAGVRPLCDDESADPKAMTRDYTLELNHQNNQLPILSVFGGKLTTYRKLAQNALMQLKPFYPNMGSEWTHQEKLPGSVFQGSIETFIQTLCQKYDWLTLPHAQRIAHAYGSRVSYWIDKPQGQFLGEQLTQAEVDYLVDHEWACCADDIIWRRSKLGLELSLEQQLSLQDYVTWRKQTQGV